MVGTQQFNLRWNNHTSNIIQVFLEHLSSGALVDVTLSCQGHFIGAHKIILSACSPYFQEVFAKHTDKHPIIILNGIKYEDLKAMIKFMYNGQIRVQEAQLDDLLAAAETLQVKGLSNVRSKYEKGEIMSLSSINNKSATTNKPIDPAATTMVIKNESPVHAIKAAVALLAPTAATTRAPNTATVISTTPATTMTATITHGIPTPSYRTAITAVPRVSNATVPTVRTSGKRASKKVAPSVAIATLVPANTLIPVPDPRLSSHRDVPRIPPVVSNVASNVVSSSVLTSSPTTTITATTMTTTTTVFSSPTTTTTTKQSALISCDNSCILTIDPTSITSGADVHFDEIDDKTNLEITTDNNSKEISDVTAVVDNTENTIVSDSNDSAQTNKNYTMPNIDIESPAIIATSTLPEIMTTTITNTPTTGPNEIEGLNKSNIAEIPRVRKRRKMSHTVNELARETVFASNGTVLLEPDEAVLRSMAKMQKVSPIETQTAENSSTGERNEIAGAKETKKPKMKVATKQPQTSLLIKDRDKNPSKVLRPPNAFMIFANEWRRKLVIKYPTESNTKISVKLGMMWKGLNIPTKEKYYRLAKKADEEHKRKFPSYYYSPKEARMRKNVQEDFTLAKCLPPRSENPESQRMVKVFVNGEERLTNYFTDTDSSNYDDDDDDDDHYGGTEYAFGNYTEPIDHPEKSDDPEQLSQLVTERDSASAYLTN